MRLAAKDCCNHQLGDVSRQPPAVSMREYGTEAENESGQNRIQDQAKVFMRKEKRCHISIKMR